MTHQENTVAFLKFCRSRRDNFLRDIDASAKDFADSRVKEPQYTSDEVGDLISDFKDQLRTDVEFELMRSSHTAILLLQQCFSQAEAIGIQLQTNAAQLDNKKMIDTVAAFEKQTFSGSNQGKDTLEQLNEMISQSVTQKLQDDIERLREENIKLLKLSERTVSGAQNSSTGSAPLEELRGKVSELEQQLEMKLQNSKPVVSLKKMLSEKNDEIRRLKQELEKRN